MSLTLQQTIPQNIEAEQAILGAILLDNDVFSRVVESLRFSDFQKPAHQKIFSVMQELYDQSEPIELLGLTEMLRRKKELDSVGGVDYLTLLEDVIPTAANVNFYVKIVKEKSIKRSLIVAGTEIATQGYEDNNDVDALLDYAEKVIFEISDKRIQNGFFKLNEIIKLNFEAIEKAYDQKKLVTGVPTNFNNFDQMTCGLQPADLIIIAGRPSMGKTAFALNIAQNAARNANIPVGVFSLEMSKEQLGMRLLCSEAKINSRDLRTGYFPKSDWAKLTHAASVLTKMPIYIDDTPNLSVLDIRARSRRLSKEHGIGLIVVDYLQLMRGRMDVESRQLEVAEITRSLKALAKEVNIPVIALSQLSRAVEQRSDRRPQLSDLRESGAIEQDADLVVFLYREDFYNPDTEEKGIAEIIIGKQRNGPTGTVKLTFLNDITRFENYHEESSERG